MISEASKNFKLTCQRKSVKISNFKRHFVDVTNYYEVFSKEKSLNTLSESNFFITDIAPSRLIRRSFLAFRSSALLRSKTAERPKQLIANTDFVLEVHPIN